MSDDIVAFCLPDFSKCGPAVGDIIPNAKEAFEWFLTFDFLNMTWEGSKDFNQNPFFACWFNIPLCLGLYCVPCCSLATQLRALEKMTGQSCESNCLSCCVLSMCCYLNACRYAKKRGEMRKKYGIKGSPCFDCFGGICFGPCMLCQDANQLMESGGFHVPYCSLAKAKEISNKVAPAK